MKSCLLPLANGMLLLFAGCSRSSTPAAQPLSSAQLQPVMDRSFAKASADSRLIARQFVAAMQNNDPAAAFVEIKQLASRSDLDTEQRATLGRAMATAAGALQAAAASGDQRASGLLHAYKASR